MDNRYSYRIIFEQKNGETQTIDFENESDAEEVFREYNDPNDYCLAERYCFAELQKIDWQARINTELASVSYL